MYLFRLCVTIIYFTLVAAPPVAAFFGGTNTPSGQPPFLAVIPIRSRSFPFCGGTIIAGGFIVTAAHCVDPHLAPGDLRVRVRNRELGHLDIPVRKVHIHPRFSPRTMSGDIALLELDRPVAVTPATLPDPKTTLQPDSNVKILGWVNNALRSLEVPIVSDKECNKAGYRLGRDQFCEGGNGKSVCNGDAGDPVLQGNTLVGIVSYSRNSCSSGKLPGVSTDIRPYLGWIQEVTGQARIPNKRLGSFLLNARVKTSVPC